MLHIIIITEIYRIKRSSYESSNIDVYACSYKGFRGNCATSFIDQFKALHQCNRYCELLDLTSLQPKPRRTVGLPKPKKKTLGPVLNAKSWWHRTSVRRFLAQERTCFWDVSLNVRWHSSVRTVGRLFLSWELFCAVLMSFLFIF